MTAHALFDVLKDFGARPQPAAVRAASPVQPAPPPPQASGEDLVQAAVTKAEAAIEERLALAHAAEIEKLRQTHAAELDAALRRIGGAAGETIALRLGEMEDRIGHQAATAAARILGALLSDELQKRSMASLVQSIKAAVAGSDTFRIEIRGPQSLIEALQAEIGDKAGNFGFSEAPGFDLSVNIDGNLFETRLAEWSALLSEILE